MKPIYEEDTETFFLHRIKLLFNKDIIRVTRMQFSERISFHGTVHRALGQTIRKVVVEFMANNFTRNIIMWIFHELERAKMCCCGESEDIPSSAQVSHPVPVAMSNPVLREAVQFSDGGNFQYVESLCNALCFMPCLEWVSNPDRKQAEGFLTIIVPVKINTPYFPIMSWILPLEGAHLRSSPLPLHYSH